MAGQLVARGHEVVEVYISLAGIERVRRAYPNVTFEVASVYDELTGITKSADLVICIEVIEHLYPQQGIIKTAWSALRREEFLFQVHLATDVSRTWS